MADTIFERLQKIMVEKLDLDGSKITMDSNFREDLKIDSLDMVELIMAIEEEFNFQEDNDEEVKKIKTMRDAVAYIEARAK